MLNGFLSPALNQCDKIIGVFDADSKVQWFCMVPIWLAATANRTYALSRTGGRSESPDHQDLRLYQKTLGFGENFILHYFLQKIYNLIQNLYTLRYHYIFNFTAHSSSG